jgi:hypothetical protein
VIAVAFIITKKIHYSTVKSEEISAYYGDRKAIEKILSDNEDCSDGNRKICNYNLESAVKIGVAHDYPGALSIYVLDNFKTKNCAVLYRVMSYILTMQDQFKKIGKNFKRYDWDREKKIVRDELKACELR